MLELVLDFFSNYLIEFMGGTLALGLVFRFAAFRASKDDNAYYSSFTRELELNVEKDKEDRVEVGDVDQYLSGVLGRVSKKLPSRSVRFGSPKDEKSGEDESRKVLSLRDYVSGKQGLITSIQAESSVFHHQTPPNFTELTHRIMSQDPHWTKVMKHFPIDGVARMIDILPGLFIVLGVVFGLLIGKPVGIVGLTYLADRLNIVKKPDTLKWQEVIAVGFLGGIGFTMSIFITQLAFLDLQTIYAVKMGIFIASFIAAVIGVCLILKANKKEYIKG